MHINLFTLSVAILYFMIFFVVCKFSYYHLKEDKKYSKFLLHFLTFIIFSYLVLLSDNIAIFITGLVGSNLSVVRLMCYQNDWRAARNAKKLAKRSLFFGNFLIGFALIVFWIKTKETSISELIISQTTQVLNNTNYIQDTFVQILLIVYFIGCIVQSGMVPFHKWLVSSLNSPTPTAALINSISVGSGVIAFTKFMPLYFKYEIALNIVVIISMMSALAGGVFMLVQTSVKGRLSCSTILNISLIIGQYSMGLVACASAHFILHTVYKCYLFLSFSEASKRGWNILTSNNHIFCPNLLVSNEVISDDIVNKDNSKSRDNFKTVYKQELYKQQSGCQIYNKNRTCYDDQICLWRAVIISGLLGVYLFYTQCNFIQYQINSTFSIFLVFFFIFLVTMVFHAIANLGKRMRLYGIMLGGSVGFLYGIAIKYMQDIFNISHFYNVPYICKINLVHILVMIIFISAYVLVILHKKLGNIFPTFFMKMYVKIISTSIADQRTITAHHNHYKQ